MAHAAYAAELVTKLCAPRQVERAVYDWLAALLGCLDAEGASAERLRVFELGLLRGSASVRSSTAAPPAGRRRRRPPTVGTPTAAARSARAARAAGGPSRQRRGRRSFTCRRFRCPMRGRETLPADVNRDCREALLEIINHHISGPLKSVEFIAKLSAAGHGGHR